MDRPPTNNAFTLLEMCLVLLIISILGFSTSAMPSISSLELFGKKMLSYCVLMQERAFAQKEKIEVSIQSAQAIFDDLIFTYPNQIVCEPHDFHYTPKGNISQGNTIVCTMDQRSIKLIFQIGSGRVRLE